MKQHFPLTTHVSVIGNLLFAGSCFVNLLVLT